MHLLNANASRYNAEHNVQASQPMVPSVIGQFAADPEQRAELGSLQVALGPHYRPSLPAIGMLPLPRPHRFSRDLTPHTSDSCLCIAR